jgi:N-acetyl-anhydromuramyl-L-alanine amidase AmpD|tara:strand:- start:1965 stop:2564 length:600 start_codon:yes stop_codon:yes gene_type:complete
MIDEIIKYGNFKSDKKNKNKTQIILTNTSRNINDFLQSLKYRYNGKYDKIPNYIVTRDGKVLQLLDNDEYTNYNTTSSINRNSVIVCLENLGWLEKEPLKNYHINWIGDIYKQKVFNKTWRDYFFWQPYPEEQIILTSKLCVKLTKETNIPLKSVEHNTKINGIEKFEGIVTKSNFDSDFTDVSPAFNFEIFNKYLKND